MDRPPARCAACPLSEIGDTWTTCPTELGWEAGCKYAAQERAIKLGSRYWRDIILERSGRGPKGTYPPAVPPDGRTRVGIVSPCCGSGGAERWISDLLDRCDPARIRWEGVAIRHEPDPSLGPNLRADWQEHCPVAVGIGAIRELAGRVDVLLTWGVFNVPWGFKADEVRAIASLTVPIVGVNHGSTEYEPGPSPRIKVIPAAVCRPALRGLPPEDREHAKIILNMASPERVVAKWSRSDVRKDWGIPEGAKVAGWMGRLSPEKRPNAFVDGIAALPHGWHGVMCGSGFPSIVNEAKALAEKLCPGRIVFAGPTEDVGSALAAFDCLVMVSESEAASLAAAEAWLAGVPLVSTPVGLLEDHPELARVIPNEAEGEQTAKAILAAHEDEVGTAERVARAKAFVRENMTPEAFGNAWSDFLVGVTKPIEVKLAIPDAEAPERLGWAAKVGSVVTAVGDLLMGDYAHPDVIAERERICLECPHQRNNATACGVCGCGQNAAFSYAGVNMVVKRNLKHSRCALKAPRWVEA